MSSNLQIPKVCQLCGKAFVARTTTTKYCGDTCSKRAYKIRIREQKVQAALEQSLQEMQSLQSPQTSQSLQRTSILPLTAKEFLSIQEAAFLIGASRWTIQRLIKNKKIKAAKIGRRTIISRSEIDKLFN